MLPPSISHINKLKSQSSGDEINDKNEESISENDLDNIVGVTDNSELEVFEFKFSVMLLCDTLITICII